MDLTAVDKIEVLNQKLAHRNVTLLFVNIEHPRFRRLVKTTNLLAILDQKTEYTSIEAAITAYRSI